MNVQYNIVYGLHSRHVMDWYVPEKTYAASPILVYFHGGGYVRGDKSDVAALPLLRECLDAGIAVVSCNYRYISADPFPAPMSDGKRAIQFVRYMADAWGMDGRRIVASGRSAGGHIALWNALKGEQKEEDHEDPVLNVSSLVCGFVGFETQVSKDPAFYKAVYTGQHTQPNIAMFYGVKSEEELIEPAYVKLAHEASAISYMSHAAPPAMFIYNAMLTLPHIPHDATPSEMIHHPIHGWTLKQRYKAYGIPCVLRHRIEPPGPGEILKFLQQCYRDVPN